MHVLLLSYIVDTNIEHNISRGVDTLTLVVRYTHIHYLHTGFYIYKAKKKSLNHLLLYTQKQEAELIEVWESGWNGLCVHIYFLVA